MKQYYINTVFILLLDCSTDIITLLEFFWFNLTFV